MSRFLLTKECIFEAVELERVDDMHTRRTRTFEEADAFMVLGWSVQPGQRLLAW